jgi:hypothetical protein
MDDDYRLTLEESTRLGDALLTVQATDADGVSLVASSYTVN